jgi:hypothetical protein
LFSSSTSNSNANSVFGSSTPSSNGTQTNLTG